VGRLFIVFSDGRCARTRRITEYIEVTGELDNWSFTGSG
jgi:hypothetical protein